MSPSSPWSVKGVEPEAREAAKLAARRAGMPIGTWLSHTIRKAAAEQLRSGGPAMRPDGNVGDAPPSQSPSFSFHGPTPSANPGGSAGTGPRPPAPTTEAVLESINRLAAKIEASEQRTAQVIEPLAEKVRDLSERIEDVRETKAIESSPLERAMARMAERLEQMEDGPRGLSNGGRERRKQGFFSRLFSD